MNGEEMGLAAQLGQLLHARGLKLVTAESCTGGWIAKRMTDIPGSSSWFEAGFVTYGNAAKSSMLGVSGDIFRTDGAVSRACVRAMAAGALERTEGNVAVAVSGIAGPGGGSLEKPVGTVWFAYAITGEAIETESCLFSGDRDAVRRTAVEHALSGLIERVGS